MDGKKTALLLSITVLSVFSFSGCGKNKIEGNKTYSSDEVKELQVSSDTWEVHIETSSDENIRIAFESGSAGKEDGPGSALQNGILSIEQEEYDEKLQDQIALGKKGEIIIGLPSDCIIPIQIRNESGDIQVEGIEAEELVLDNRSGYVTFSDFTAGSLKVTSESGDITLKNSEMDDVQIVTMSGYVQQSAAEFANAEIVTKSGEVNMDKISPDANIWIQTGSGDVSLKYRSAPDNLGFEITSGSKDISLGFQDAVYRAETESSRQGSIGSGQNELKIKSEKAAVIVR